MKKALAGFLSAVMLLSAVPAVAAQEMKPAFEAFSEVADSTCTVTVRDVDTDAENGCRIDLLLENKSERRMVFTLMDASVDGENVQADFEVRIPAAKKANKTLFLPIPEDNTEGVKLVELTFAVLDSESGESFADQTIQIYPQGRQEEAQSDLDLEEDDILLAQTEEITVAVTDFARNDSQGFGVRFLFENKTNKIITATLEDVSLNGFMLETDFANALLPGKTSEVYAWWSPKTLAENNILEPEELEFSLLVTDPKEPEKAILNDVYTVQVDLGAVETKENEAKVAEEISLRSAPSTGSRVITTLYAGETVEAIRVESIGGERWVYALSEAMNVTGWVQEKYLDMNNVHVLVGTSDTPGGPQVIESGDDEVMKLGTITAETLNIRSSASVAGDWVGTYTYGDEVEILEIREGWGRTDRGWISLTYVYFEGETEPSVYGTVTATQLNIRSGPGVEFEIVGSVAKGERIEITEQVEVADITWGFANGGWVSLKYVELDP